MRKVVAIVVIVVTLGAQLYAMLPPEGRGTRPHRYWPFINYPMYAWPRHAGDFVRIDELHVVPCDGGPAETLTAAQLHILPYRFAELLERLSRSGEPNSTWPPPEMARQDRAMLTSLILRERGTRFCRAEIHEKDYVMNAEGWNPARDIPWHATASWSLREP